jgi:hypothetical protein
VYIECGLFPGAILNYTKLPNGLFIAFHGVSRKFSTKHAQYYETEQKMKIC